MGGRAMKGASRTARNNGVGKSRNYNLPVEGARWLWISERRHVICPSNRVGQRVASKRIAPKNACHRLEESALSSCILPLSPSHAIRQISHPPISSHPTQEREREREILRTTQKIMYRITPSFQTSSHLNTCLHPSPRTGPLTSTNQSIPMSREVVRDIGESESCMNVCMYVYMYGCDHPASNTLTHPHTHTHTLALFRIRIQWWGLMYGG